MATAFQSTAFNTSLFNCCDDVSSCLDGLFCPYCQVSQQYNLLTTGHREIHFFLCGSMMIADIFCMAGLALVGGTIVTRNEARNRLGLLEETAFDSCCKAFWCTPCSICQVYREMSIRQRWPGGICVNQPYTKVGLINAPGFQSMNPAPVVTVYDMNPPQQGYSYGAPPPQRMYPAAGGTPGYSYGQPPPTPVYGQPVYTQQPQPSYGVNTNAYGYSANPNPAYGYGQPPQQPVYAVPHEPAARQGSPNYGRPQPPGVLPLGSSSASTSPTGRSKPSGGPPFV